MAEEAVNHRFNPLCGHPIQAQCLSSGIAVRMLVSTNVTCCMCSSNQHLVSDKKISYSSCLKAKGSL